VGSIPMMLALTPSSQAPRDIASFTSVLSESMSGLMRLMASPEGFHGPLNLGNPQEVTILELAEKIRSLVGSASVLRMIPQPEDDPARRKPDISLARRTLDWRPSVTLEEGLLRTIEYFRAVTPAQSPEIRAVSP